MAENQIMMNYEETLEKIHSFNVFGSRLGLERMNKLLSLLGDPHEKLRVIHVAGTNGKGSVCRYVYSVLSDAGYKVGAYFSPYIERFTERIELAGQEISEQDLALYAERTLHAIDIMLAEGFESPTEFELVTAIGFLYFAEKEADFVILEVGLGGSGDSTNVCKKPLATAITSISYDHMAQLGNTLELIAADKAGILKESAPAVVCVNDFGAFEVIRGKAEILNVPFINVLEAEVSNMEEKLGGIRLSVVFSINNKKREYKDIEISMSGRHQADNALCALHIIEIIKDSGYDISDKAVYDGIKKAFQPARFEIVRREPYLILDGAHNEAGVKALADTLLAHFPEGKFLLCIGVLKDKEFDKMARELCRLNADIIITSVPNPRSMAAAELADVFSGLEPYKSGNRSVFVREDYRQAVKLAEELEGRNRSGQVKPDGAFEAPAEIYGCRAVEIGGGYDAVVWAGSLYLIGPVRSLVRSED